ncbi:MAG: basic amino acid ABC transporter substrate-binding protein, partial [Epulopiscium sp.]|nr:basic amino acid ABC transporter substrate-binding protein [Candidatus Epulonipiscium sp.]
MKQKMSMMMILILCISILGACSTPKDGGTKKDTTEAGAAGNKKTLILGTNAEFPPFEYREGEEIVGFDIDLGKEIAKELGLELKVEDMIFDGLIPALQAGKIDIILAGMTIKPDRLENANFSDFYFTASQMILLHKDNDTILGPDDLVKKKIGVQLGTTGDEVAQEIEGAEVIQFPAAYAALLELSNKKIDAVILDLEVAKRFLTQNKDLKMLDIELTEEEYAAAINKKDTELLAQVNEALKTLKENGTYDTLLKK